MKASQGFRFGWSRRMQTIAMIYLIVALFSACISQPNQPPSSPTPRPNTTISIPTKSLSLSPTPEQAPTTTSSSTSQATCKLTNGVMVAGEIESHLLGKPYNFQIYLPACYGVVPEQRYPVIYLLHGLYSDETQWDLIGIADAVDTFVKDTELPFIVVMPRIPNGNTSTDSSVNQIIPTELIPYIDSQYLTLTDCEHRAIGGVSRGASLALRIGVDRRDLFGKIGMHSLPMLIDESTAYAHQLGELDTEDRPLLFMDSGNNDRDLQVARYFDLELTKLAIPHTWYMFSGYHNEAYWGEHLPIYLEWYAQGW